jgi:transposase
MVYIGVDLHRKRSQLAVLDADGAQRFNRSIPTRPAEFLRVFGELAPRADRGRLRGHRRLALVRRPAGRRRGGGHMAHPLAPRAIATARVKNDAIDARTLAHLLRTHLLPEAWIAPPAVRQARRLVRMRVSLVRIRSRLTCQVHALLAEHAIEVPMSDVFGRDGRRLLAELRLPELVQHRLEANLRLIDAVGAEIARAEAEIRERFAGDTRIARLRTIPGIGPLIAATIVAEIWEVARFSGPDALCSWAGLTPRERSSAEHTRRGHISKQGARWVRWICVEAATRAVRDERLGRFAARIARRRGVKIARVALARRLLTLAFYALRDPSGCAAYPLDPARSA